ncbi:MAG: metal-dependent hydrolase [Deltaproteobacteria bacterium]|jgi:L-ascorbate metabolism protein UlaG (beta-lactamase superfamily)|nr:metal-dependent hydrolase [Deltaproteobacteria bacterium]
MQIRWYGHSNVQASDGKAVVCVDPFFEGNPVCKDDWKTIPAPDLVLVTHDHGDHAGQALEICQATDAMLGCVVGTGARFAGAGLSPSRLFAGMGFNMGGTVEHKGIRVTMTPALHSSESSVPVGYIVRMPSGFTFYHAGDTCVFGDMAIWGELHPLDLALLPVGGFFTMDARQAALACKLLKAKALIPLHWGTFPVLASGTDELKAELAKQAPACRLIALSPGEAAIF